MDAQLIGSWSPMVIYFIGIGLGSTVILIGGLRLLRRLELKRLKFVERKDFSEAVETESPEEDPENLNRHLAVKSIESRFSTIRRSFVPLVLLFTLVFIAVPLLPSLSATYVTLVASILAVVVGIAAKPVVENFFAGLVITLNQPIRIGDTVIVDGRYGTVERINMFYTVVKIWNWRRYMVPNSKMIQKEFENLSHHGENEWAHVVFWVSPSSDIEKVKEISKRAMKQSKVLKDVEPPSFWIIDLQKDAIECWVAGWVDSPAEAWTLRSTTRKYLIKYFQQEGIDFHMSRGQFQIQSNAMSEASH